jgi:hypothetical protein
MFLAGPTMQTVTTSAEIEVVEEIELNNIVLESHTFSSSDHY